VGHQKADPLAGRVGRGEHRRGPLHHDVHRLGDEGEPRVPEQRPGKQVRLAQDLEPVADPQDRAARCGVALDRLHHRAEPRDRPGPEVVAVAEPAGQDHHVGAAQVGVPVPDQVGVGTDRLGGPHRVDIGVTAGKLDHRDFEHQVPSTSRR
jgi:hypothetical protein